MLAKVPFIIYSLLLWTIFFKEEYLVLMNFIYFDAFYELDRLGAVRCEESFPKAEFSHPDYQKCYCNMHNLPCRITAPLVIVPSQM